MSECDRGYYETKIDIDFYSSEEYYTHEWVQACNWQSETTFRDVCKICGKVFTYTNSNGYPEETLNAVRR